MWWNRTDPPATGLLKVIGDSERQVCGTSVVSGDRVATTESARCCTHEASASVGREFV